MTLWDSVFLFQAKVNWTCSPVPRHKDITELRVLADVGIWELQGPYSPSSWSSIEASVSTEYPERSPVQRQPWSATEFWLVKEKNPTVGVARGMTCSRLTLSRWRHVLCVGVGGKIKNSFFQNSLWSQGLRISTDWFLSDEWAARKLTKLSFTETGWHQERYSSE